MPAEKWVREKVACYACFFDFVHTVHGVHGIFFSSHAVKIYIVILRVFTRIYMSLYISEYVFGVYSVYNVYVFLIKIWDRRSILPILEFPS